MIKINLLRDELYNWMKNLALFYLLFTVFLHLVPDKSYERYIRFFMGLLLILLLCTPVFSFFGKEEEFLQSFQTYWSKENQFLEMNSLQMLGEQIFREEIDYAIERKYGLTPDGTEIQNPLHEHESVADSVSDRNTSGDSVTSDWENEEQQY